MSGTKRISGISKPVDCRSILEAIRRSIRQRACRVALHEPCFEGNESRYVQECLKTGWVSSAGEFVTRFEKQLSHYTGADKAVAVVNGTSALHMALQGAGVERNDEVLVPTLTFVATANAVVYCGAFPHFVDSDERSLGVDPEKLLRYLRAVSHRKRTACFNKKTGRRIKALVVMHAFGHPVDMDPLLEIARLFHLELIEDAAQSLGSIYKGRFTGTIARFAVLSFNGNKIITTGGGGAVLTNDKRAGERIKHLSSTARVPHPWEIAHDDVAYNYRMPNLNAALGCAQLERVETFVAQKRRLAERYEKAFHGAKDVSFFREPGYARSNYWLNAVLLKTPSLVRRDRLLAYLNRQGICARPAWKLMHTLPMFSTLPRMDLSTAERLEARLVNLPSSAALAGDQ